MSTALPNRAGRPLKFLGAVISLWTIARLGIVYGASNTVEPLIPLHATSAFAHPIGYIADNLHFRPSPGSTGRVWHPQIGLSHIWAIPAAGEPPERLQPANIRQNLQFAEASPTPSGDTAAAAVPVVTHLPALPVGGNQGARRLQGSAWMLWRAQTPANALAHYGQLGGAQIGARVDYRLTGSDKNALFAYGRASAALYVPHAEEVAVGVAWRPPTPLPVSIGVERRIAIGHGARDAFAVIATTGIGPTAIAPGVQVEGYGQGGVVGLRRRDLFVDGRVALTHPVHHTPLSAGVSVSGGAQPNLSRLDIGPVVDARLNIGGVRPRLAVEWRQRVAGKAAPDSGVAVTLASDF